MDPQIKLPRPNLDLMDQDDDVLLAMLIFGEARGAGPGGRVGVGSVAKNRADHPRWWGKSLKQVITNPLQFSCFRPEDPNHPKLFLPLKYEAPEVWDSCYWIAKGILSGSIADNTRGADHYFDDSIKPPKWAKAEKKTVKIGRLNFYRIELEG